MTMTLQEISDRLEIQELFVDYTQAIDRRNWDALDDVFTADAHIDYASTGGSVGDLPSTKEFLAQAMPMFKSFQHLVGTSKIVVDGDTATATSILHNPMVLPQKDGPPRTFFVGVWYHDKLVRTAGRMADQGAGRGGLLLPQRARRHGAGRVLAS